jgi:ABC-type multidrug transport system fused ATPase/permease subunit
MSTYPAMKNSYISLLRTAWKYARKERRRYVFVYSLFVFANLTESVQPILLGWLINHIQTDSPHILRHVFTYVGALACLKLAHWGFHGPARIMERKLAFNLSRNFLHERYHQALHLPVKWHQDHHSGSSINRIRKAYEALRGFFDGGFLYLHALLKFFFSLVAMIYFSTLFGTIGLIMGLFIISVIRRFDKPIVTTQEEINECEHTVSAALFDSLSNIMTVITLRLEQNMEKGLMSKLAVLWRPFRRNVLTNEWKWFTADMLIVLTYGVIVIGYIYQQWTPGHVFLVGGLVMLLGYVNQFTSVFYDMAWQYNQIIEQNTNVQTASNIEKAYVLEHRPDLPSSLNADWQEIEIRNLNFSHDHTLEDLPPAGLQNINIKMHKGKRIALVGESGGGKSTLLALLRGLYDPEPGLSVEVDGRKSSMATLNQTVTLVPQEPEIFENTILYNITLGLPFPEADVMEVCRQARFAEVAERLPRGLDSDIKEKGVNLSGGQKQRLALARGILAARESEIVLLDEPTSSVDPKTESSIYQHLFQAFSQKAFVATLHRLHWLHLFDYVYVVSHGQIVEEGSFDWLRVHGYVFRDLWKHQADLDRKFAESTDAPE